MTVRDANWIEIWGSVMCDRLDFRHWRGGSIFKIRHDLVDVPWCPRLQTFGTSALWNLHCVKCWIWNRCFTFPYKKTQTVDVLQGTETKLQSRTWDWAGTRHQNYLGENSSNPILGRWFQCCGSSEDLIPLSFSSTAIAFLVTKTGMWLWKKCSRFHASGMEIWLPPVPKVHFRPLSHMLKSRLQRLDS